MKIVIWTCLVPLHLNDPLISFLIPSPQVPGVAWGVHSSSAELLILSPAALSCLAVPCVLRVSCQPQSLSWNAPSPSSPGLTSGTDLGSALMVTKFLGTASAFGSWTCVQCRQHPPAPLDLTAALDLLIFLFLFFFFFIPRLSLKKQENFYQITHDVNAKLCCEMTANMLFSRCLTRQ